MAHPRTARPPRPNGPTPAEPEYVLGTDAEESARLGLQHRLWSAAAHLLWERAGLRPGHVALDLGCGPGHATLDMAQIVGPSGRVIAVDESPPFLKQLDDLAKARRLTNIQRILGDAQQLEHLLGDARGGVDLVYARWVLCFLPDPEGVVRQAAAMLRPGGHLAVQDYFNYESMTLAPRREIHSKIVRATAASWRANGGNPDVAGDLPGMCRRAGLRVEHLGVNQRLATPGSPLWSWPDTWWKSFLPRLEKMGFITEGDRLEFERTWAQASGDPAAFVLVPPVFDVIAVKA